MIVHRSKVKVDWEVLIVRVDVDEAVQDAVVDLPIILCKSCQEWSSPCNSTRTNLIIFLQLFRLVDEHFYRNTGLCLVGSNDKLDQL